MLGEEWRRLKGRLRTQRDCVEMYASVGNVHKLETLVAIRNQACMLACTGKNDWLVKQTDRFVREYQQGESLVNIASRCHVPPTLLVRRMLAAYMKLSRKEITAVLRDPGKMEDERMKNEVTKCVQMDDLMGPRWDKERMEIGSRYEQKLCELVAHWGVQFDTEHDLRKMGSFKTPDLLLKVPVAVDGRIVNWIDSKAKFGDDFFLKKDYKDSIKSYVLRFGPGMVLYWFGYITDHRAAILADEDVIVCDSFPQNPVFLPGARIPTTVSTELS